MTDWTQERIARGLKVCAEATPEPWRHGFSDGSGKVTAQEGGWITTPSGEDVCAGGYNYGRYGFYEEYDLDFTIHARTEYPAALLHIREQAEEITQLKAQVAKLATLSEPVNPEGHDNE